MKKIWTKPVASNSTMSMEVNRYAEAELDDGLLFNK